VLAAQSLSAASKRSAKDWSAAGSRPLARVMVGASLPSRKTMVVLSLSMNCRPSKVPLVAVPLAATFKTASLPPWTKDAPQCSVLRMARFFDGQAVCEELIGADADCERGGGVGTAADGDFVDGLYLLLICRRDGA